MNINDEQKHLLFLVARDAQWGLPFPPTSEKMLGQLRELVTAGFLCEINSPMELDYIPNNPQLKTSFELTEKGHESF